MRPSRKKRRKYLSSNSQSSVIPGDLNLENLPSHIAIIMDGNGRWAKKRLLNRVKGHEKGSDTVRQVVRTCRELGIGVLTLYAFSTENWQRPQAEVSALMALLQRFLKSEQQEMVANGIRLEAIGQIERLPKKVRLALDETRRLTARNRGMQLNLALSYGSRTEIQGMVQTIARKVADGLIQPEDIDERLISDHLYTKDLPDPDLLIRTSGEMRISNFLLWQIAYSELHITPTLWPDFGREELLRILQEYQSRERRFGRVSS
jgi:undecaprenyl diphosphate synthase